MTFNMFVLKPKRFILLLFFAAHFDDFDRSRLVDWWPIQAERGRDSRRGLNSIQIARFAQCHSTIIYSHRLISLIVGLCQIFAMHFFGYKRARLILLGYQLFTEGTFIDYREKFDSFSA